MFDKRTSRVNRNRERLYKKQKKLLVIRKISLMASILGVFVGAVLLVTWPKPDRGIWLLVMGIIFIVFALVAHQKLINLKLEIDSLGASVNNQPVRSRAHLKLVK